MPNLQLKTSMLSVQNLTKYYDAQLILHNLNFEIHPGEIVGFLGHNGAGKSTTLQILAGALAPSQGTCKWQDLDVIDNPIPYKRSVGYLPEVLPLYPEMTVLNYLEFCANIHQCSDQKISIEWIVHTLNLTSVLHKRIQYLSKGWQQRVGLAQALIHRPKLLLLDEPSNGLDPQQRLEFHHILRELRNTGCAILLSSHIIAEVQSIANRILLINQGHLQNIDQNPDKILLKVTVSLPQAQRISEIQQIPTVSHVHFQPHPPHFSIACLASDRPKIAELLVRDGLLEFQTVDTMQQHIHKWMTPMDAAP